MDRELVGRGSVGLPESSANVSTWVRLGVVGTAGAAVVRGPPRLRMSWLEESEPCQGCAQIIGRSG